MPSGKPDPKCNDCKGKGNIDLLNWSSECDCVNRKPSPSEAIKNFSRAFKKYEYEITGHPSFEKDFEIKPVPDLKPIDPDLLRESIKRLQLSADYIADGITTWCMWPGIEGATCDGCGVEMNVLGMSYNHWCPVCDPEGKKYVMHSMHGHGRIPFDHPVFGPSIDTIREGSRLAKERKKKRDR